jgi:hypothetical protein
MMRPGDEGIGRRAFLQLLGSAPMARSVGAFEPMFARRPAAQASSESKMPDVDLVLIAEPG